MIRSPRRSGRRWWAGAAAVVGAAAATASLTGVSPALAANDYLEFSLDGKTYSATTSGPVFSDAFTYSPGTSSTATLWVRNAGTDSASLTAAAVMVRSAAELDGYLGLSTGTQTERSARTPLGAQGSCTDLEPAWDLGAGEERKLTLVVDLSFEAPNSTKNRTADLDLLFLLEAAAAGDTARPACDALADEDGDPTEPGGDPTAPGVTPAQPTDALPGTPADAGADTAAGAAGVTAVPGIRSAPAAAGQAAAGGPARVRTAGLAADTGVEPRRGDLPGVAARKPADIQPAGFQSTVEPIIRSLSGTLLIGMSVLFTAAAVLRIRNRRA